jgi:hypothetical protein
MILGFLNTCLDDRKRIIIGLAFFNMFMNKFVTVLYRGFLVCDLFFLEFIIGAINLSSGLKGKLS